MQNWYILLHVLYLSAPILVYHVGFSIKGDVEDGGEVCGEDGGEVGVEVGVEDGGEVGGEDGTSCQGGGGGASPTLNPTLYQPWSKNAF